MPVLRLEQVRLEAKMKFDGELTYGYDEDGVCQINWNNFPAANGGAAKTLYDILRDVRAALDRDIKELVSIAKNERSESQ